MTRILVAVSVAAPLVVGGATLLLIAKALGGSWLWGGVILAAFVLAYGVAVAFAARWAKRQPDQAEGFLTAWGRAMAFGSGGWEKQPRADSRER